MPRVINLEDIDIESLSEEALEQISRLTNQILKETGKGFIYNDPYLLPKIGRRVKSLNNPKIREMYLDYKRALMKSVNSGQFAVRPQQLINYRRNRPEHSERFSV